MRHLKNLIRKVDELSRTGSFFLCPEQSARHFQCFSEFNLVTMLESARHSTVSASSICGETIYVEFFNAAMSVSYSEKQLRVKHHG